MKNVIFWDVTPCGSCKNRRFGGTYRLHQQGRMSQRARYVSSNWKLKHTAKNDSETSTRAIRQKTVFFNSEMYVNMNAGFEPTFLISVFQRRTEQLT
jgi:hypothetical protein